MTNEEKFLSSVSKKDAETVLGAVKKFYKIEYSYGDSTRLYRFCNLLKKKIND